MTKAYYRLRSVDYDGKSEVSHIIYIERTSGSDFEIFPNPANDVLYLNFKMENYQNGNVSLFDLNGKLVQQSVLNYSNNKLNINDLQKGIYFIEVEVEGQILRKRILKQ